ncbi:hypothetical protein [Longimicrobium sp.]|jgi:hypothetical protein|uniref:hypothetical protein n=1 Tax=Longimicrobium sp. TaxID=2029185 RepID=UPI002EDB9298
MAANHLEQLVAEWYEYQGYFIRRNIKVGRRKKGGHEGELDIVAFHPDRQHLVHIETSLDAQAWEKREVRFAKKFELGRQFIPSLFSGLAIPSEIESHAVLLFAAKTGGRKSLGGGRLILVSELLEEILSTLVSVSILSNMVDEQKPLLRTLQFVAYHRKQLAAVLQR